jgi:hypothetical protein
MGDERDSSLREHLLYLLRGGGAHVKLDEALKGFPPDLFNRKVEGVPYTPWQLLEHMRIAQWDIVEFSRTAAHVSPEWPEGYWPEEGVGADGDTWQRTNPATSTRVSRTATNRRFSARRCSSPTTTPTTSVRSSRSAALSKPRAAPERFRK